MSDYKVETVGDLHSRGFEYLQVVHVAEVEAREEEITRLRPEIERLRGLAESEIMGFMSVAVEICRQEADEWDSDRVQTVKNYAEVCGQRIEKLMPGSAKAHILEKQADAVEAAIEWLHNQYPKLDGPHLGLLTTRVQRLRQQAAESAGGEDAL